MIGATGIETEVANGAAGARALGTDKSVCAGGVSAAVLAGTDDGESTRVAPDSSSVADSRGVITVGVSARSMMRVACS